MTAFEPYLQPLDEPTAASLRMLINLLRKMLPGYREEIKWGMPVLSASDQEYVGLAARKGYVSLYIPHYDLVEKYLPVLGKVRTGKSCIRFRNLEDLNLEALENLLLEAQLKNDKNPKS